MLVNLKVPSLCPRAYLCAFIQGVGVASACTFDKDNWCSFSEVFKATGRIITVRDVGLGSWEGGFSLRGCTAAHSTCLPVMEVVRVRVCAGLPSLRLRVVHPEPV